MGTAISCEVMRTAGPMLWKEPARTRPHPRPSPTAMGLAADSCAAAAFNTRARGRTVRPGMRPRSVARLSAMPAPSHWTSALPDRLSKSSTASTSGIPARERPSVRSRRSRRKSAAVA